MPTRPVHRYIQDHFLDNVSQDIKDPAIFVVRNQKGKRPLRHASAQCSFSSSSISLDCSDCQISLDSDCSDCHKPLDSDCSDCNISLDFDCSDCSCTLSSDSYSGNCDDLDIVASNTCTSNSNTQLDEIPEPKKSKHVVKKDTKKNKVSKSKKSNKNVVKNDKKKNKVSKSKKPGKKDNEKNEVSKSKKKKKLDKCDEDRDSKESSNQCSGDSPQPVSCKKPSDTCSPANNTHDCATCTDPCNCIRRQRNLLMLVAVVTLLLLLASTAMHVLGRCKDKSKACNQQSAKSWWEVTFGESQPCVRSPRLRGEGGSQACQGWLSIFRKKCVGCLTSVVD